MLTFHSKRWIDLSPSAIKLFLLKDCFKEESHCDRRRETEKFVLSAVRLAKDLGKLVNFKILVEFVSYLQPVGTTIRLTTFVDKS